MKKWMLILVLFTMALACSSDQTISRKIENVTGVSANKDKMGDGSDFYSYNVQDILLGEKVKGIIDKELNVSPAETKERQIDAFGKYIYDHYLWETPKQKVVYEFKYNYPDSNKYQIKVWITEK